MTKPGFSECLKIGPFYLTTSPYSETNFWLEVVPGEPSAGEGMEVPEKALVELLEKYYQENF